MITGLLLLPVFLILTWLYWYFLPVRRWQVADVLVPIAVVLITACYVVFVRNLEFQQSGPMWPLIVSLAGAYVILILGLSAGLWWRSRSR